ncbi:hypothetical protein [Natribacillus halophilus]|uniref:Uncharacterized protein n=1 Tax=Natribacillus halophilus TaxID=549003 RepID=A0A1G8LN16_9BACI|nr:hypothetical protein [Natribacillus halophilus]SDI57111.1 hypothetical protein SAMN04488123_103185 [Natribacillus halophilus]
MTGRDWWVALAVIAIGLHCLCMSGIISAAYNVPSYFHLLFNISLWMGKPLLAGVVIYVLFLFISKRRSRRA